MDPPHQRLRLLIVLCTVLASEAQTVATTTPSPSICGGTYYVGFTERSLVSPNYPNLYPNNLQCTYHLVAQNGTTSIQLRVVDFKAATSTDYLEIRSAGHTSAIWSRPPLVGALYKGSVSVTLTFYTDSSGQSTGFHLRYFAGATNLSASIPPAYCDSNLTFASNTVQYLHSPTYNNDLDCTYILRSSNNFAVSVSVIYFETEACCDKLYLSSGPGQSVWSGTNNYGNSFAGTQGSDLTLRFVTDASVTSTGFLLAYIASWTGVPSYLAPLAAASSCDDDISLTATEEPAFLYSPNYPNYYPNDVSCEWTITSDDSRNLVQLEKVDYHVHASYSYSWTHKTYRRDPGDDFYVYSGSGSNKKKRISFSNGKNGTSQCNAMFVKFETDNSKRERGFMLRYHTVSANGTEFEDCRKKDYGPLIGGLVAGVVLITGLSIFSYFCHKRKWARKFLKSWRKNCKRSSIIDSSTQPTVHRPARSSTQPTVHRPAQTTARNSSEPTEVSFLPVAGSINLNVNQASSSFPPSYQEFVSDPGRFKSKGAAPDYTAPDYKAPVNRTSLYAV